MLYSGIGEVDKYTSIGISIFKLESKKAITIDGVDYTLVEALAQKQYNKVYICLGVNELGYFNDQASMTPTARSSMTSGPANPTRSSISRT